MTTYEHDGVKAEDIVVKSGAGLASSGDEAEAPGLFGRKSLLVGIAASMGIVVANVAQPSSAAAAAATYVPKWAPATNYTRGQQVVSPNNDVVSANVAHRSSAAYATDTAKWTLSYSYAPVAAAWLPTYAYKANQLVTYGGLIYSAKMDFTSGTSFYATDWTAIGGGGGGGSVTDEAVAPLITAPLTSAALSSIYALKGAGGGGTLPMTSAERTLDGAIRIHAGYYRVVGIDAVQGVMYAMDDTEGPFALRRSVNGVNWSSSSGGRPADAQSDTVVKVVRFGSKIYLTYKSLTDGKWKLASGTPTPAGSLETDPVWTVVGSAPTPASGAAYTGTSLHASTWATGTNYLYLCEYGDPVGGPSVFRSADGSSWTRVLGPITNLRHMHAIAADPYNPGHVYLTAGDGTGPQFFNSTDSGATWTVMASASGVAWQAVQISFTSTYVVFAGDNGRDFVILYNRAAGKIQNGTLVPPKLMAVPGGAVGDQFFANCWIGAVDPATGFYYGVARDGRGTRTGLFVLTQPGAAPALLDPLPINEGYNSEVFLYLGYLWFGNFKIALLTQ